MGLVPATLAGRVLRAARSAGAPNRVVPSRGPP
jgi:hypothetical protein